ncbi:GNAT family N-acetyltransferase [Chitinophaga pendula]|uniref:GNAT family N-acetyltransferase n=1 Tax=Chitinophaga TaxID=79328 RepID=UPI000BAEDC7B|nr:MULTISPECIES: GNAT family protein [Chitinophaga]ASZ12983.1 GNAT family N-acetyltransferase [Chitinophaga sp. MD30]UCJ09385.1 GNAT family N-acetyltransferase [Chitinophaga pendula]
MGWHCRKGPLLVSGKNEMSYLNVMKISVTAQILLESIGQEHAAAIFELVKANKQQLGEWLPWVGRMTTVTHFETFVVASMKRAELGEELSCIIRVGDAVAGRIGLYNIDGYNRIADIGYWLGTAYQGQGVVTLACEELLRYAFEVLHLNRIQIKCGTLNEKSQAVPERLHFTKEGIIRQGEYVNNRFIDLYLYAMVREEWLKNNNK